MENFSKARIIINALLFMAIVLLSIVRPQGILDYIGYQLRGLQSSPAFFASYGGLLVAIGILMLVGMQIVSMVTVLAAVVIMCTRSASGRIVGILQL